VTLQGTLISLDPGSKRTGYAVFDGNQLADAGYLHSDDDEAPAMPRIIEMANDLIGMIAVHQPRRIVIEVSSGHVGKRRHTGGGHGLAIYGEAAGALVAAAHFEMVRLGRNGGRPPAVLWGVVPVLENVWTRGKRKNVRRDAIMMEFPQYRALASKDGGADVSDGIGLGLWWLPREALGVCA
jgi:hypothetical protein